MLQWETLKAVTKIRSFLGFVRYYRRFGEGLSKLALSLTLLSRKGEPYVSDAQCEESFQ